MQQLAMVGGLGETVLGAVGQHGLIERWLVAAEQHYGVLLAVQRIEASDHLLRSVQCAAADDHHVLIAHLGPDGVDGERLHIQLPFGQQGTQGRVAEGIRLQQPDPLALNAIQRQLLGLGQGRDVHIQAEGEDGPLAQLGFKTDLASHLLYQLLGDDQTQASAAITARDGGVGLIEGLEQLALLLFRDADTGIADQYVEPHLVAVAAAGLLYVHIHVATLGELDGVAGEVGQHLLQAHGIASEIVRHLGIYLQGEFELLVVSTGAEQVHGLVEGVAQAERDMLQLQLACLQLGEVEDVVDDA